MKKDIFCVPKDSAPQSVEVADYNVYSLFSKGKFYKSETDARKEEYVPLNCVCIIRSATSNKVLGYDYLEAQKYYKGYHITNAMPIYSFDEKSSEDIITYCASLMLNSMVHTEKLTSDERLRTAILNAWFQTLGLFNPDPDLVDVSIISNLIFKDEDFEVICNYLKEGVSVVPINEMNPIYSLKAILSKIVEVKNGDNNN